jgi:hypothetical protein
VTVASTGFRVVSQRQAGAPSITSRSSSIESGYGHYEMARIDGTWKITHHAITHHLPGALSEN